MAHALQRALALMGGTEQAVASAHALAFASTHKGAADRMADRVVRLL